MYPLCRVLLDQQPQPPVYIYIYIPIYLHNYIHTFVLNGKSIQTDIEHCPFSLRFTVSDPHLEYGGPVFFLANSRGKDLAVGMLRILT